MDSVYLSPPDIRANEIELVADALASNWVAPLGPHVDAFERELARQCGVADVAVLTSATAAIHLALLLAGVGPGDEVLGADLTFVASVNPLAYVGAVPILVDCDRATWTIDPVLVEETVAARARQGRVPKALIAVDLYGQCADYASLERISAEYGITLIEDAAQALGATAFGRPAGSFGDMSVLSFNGNKVITTGGGGALCTNDPAMARRARFLASQARDPAPHYEHSEIGFNYRMSNVAAAIGRGQLSSLDERVAARRSHHKAYVHALGDLPGIDFMPEAPYGFSSRWLTTIRIDADAFGATRDDVSHALDAADIESRPVFKPMHLQPLYRDAEIVGGAVSEAIFRDGLCLPSGSSLGAADRNRVIEIIAGLHRA